jgi:hypothetical protein
MPLRIARLQTVELARRQVLALTTRRTGPENALQLLNWASTVELSAAFWPVVLPRNGGFPALRNPRLGIRARRKFARRHDVAQRAQSSEWRCAAGRRCGGVGS